MNSKRVVRSRASRIGRDNDEGASRNVAMKSKLRGARLARYILCNHSYDVDYLIQVSLQRYACLVGGVASSRHGPRQ